MVTDYVLQNKRLVNLKMERSKMKYRKNQNSKLKASVSCETNTIN